MGKGGDSAIYEMHPYEGQGEMMMMMIKEGFSFIRIVITHTDIQYAMT
jgi:hypothetical protein